MFSNLKKSLITDWWVAESHNKFGFVDILSGKPLGEDLFVVGYFDQEKTDLATSTNRVMKVTKNGVVTEKGTFYPFQEAHNLYLSFLIEMHKGDALVATFWDYASKLCKNKIVADIIHDGNIEEGVIFDFIPDKKYDVMFVGYSKKLSSKVILTTFSRRVCIALGIHKGVKSDIYHTSITTEEETMEKVRQVQSIFAGTFEQVS